MTFPKPYVAVDAVVFGFDPHAEYLQVLLIERAEGTYRGHLALPGGYMHAGETAQGTAYRVLKDKTAIRPTHLEQLYTFSDPDRDPGDWVIAIAYLGVIRSDKLHPQAGFKTKEAFWSGIDKALSAKLAFDHNDILEMALERLSTKVRYSPLGFELLPTEFTLGELKDLYEALLRRTLDASNFHKRMQALGVLTEKGVRRGDHRPAPTYSFNRSAYDDLLASGITLDFAPKKR